MIQKIFKVRADVIVGLAALAASILVAILIRRRPYLAECIDAAMCRAVPASRGNYSVTFRLGVVVAGLLAAGLVHAAGTFMRRHVGGSFGATGESSPAS